MVRIFSRVLLIGLVWMSLSGCWATLVKGSRSDLQMTSMPQGAAVYVNGVHKGTTPLKLKLKSNENYTIEFKKVGYETATRNVSSSIGAGWVILDVVFGLVPVIVDAVTGSWYKLDQENLNVTLQKQQKGKEAARTKKPDVKEILKRAGDAVEFIGRDG